MHMQLVPQADERLDLITNHLLGLAAVLAFGYGLSHPRATLRMHANG